MHCVYFLPQLLIFNVMKSAEYQILRLLQNINALIFHENTVRLFNDAVLLNSLAKFLI